MKILICAALKSELIPVKEHLNQEKIPESIEVEFLKTGMGISNIKTKLADLLEKNKYDYVINSGTAGSLKEDLHVGEIFIPTKIEYFDNQKKLNTYLTHNIETNTNWKTGILVTSDKDITTTTDREKLKAKTKAEAVDMEAFEAAKLCKSNDISFISVKVISDYADSFNKSNYKKTMKKITPYLAKATYQIINQTI